jgi:uncharacterized OB-fold protein
MSDAKPLPAVNEESAPYWRAAREGRLILRSCRNCGHIMFYPRIVCARCASADLDWREASGRGTIHAATVCYRAPDQSFRPDVPYVVALIDLEEGPRMMSNITDCAPEDVRIGAAVEVWFDAATDEIGIPKFRLSNGGTS